MEKGYAEVRVSKVKAGESKLHHLEIHPGVRGHKKFMGAAVHHLHHFPQARDMAGFGGEPMTHVASKHHFGPEDGGKLLAHIGKHLGIPNSSEEAGEADHAYMGHEVEVED